MQRPCAIENFLSYDETVPVLLRAIGAPPVLARQSRIRIKPNLVNASPQGSHCHRPQAARHHAGFGADPNRVCNRPADRIGQGGISQEITSV
jgi:hypothetical protein